MVGKYVEKSVVAALGGVTGNSALESMVRKVVEEVVNEREKGRALSGAQV